MGHLAKNAGIHRHIPVSRHPPLTGRPVEPLHRARTQAKHTWCVPVGVRTLRYKLAGDEEERIVRRSLSGPLIASRNQVYAVLFRHVRRNRRRDKPALEVTPATSLSKRIELENKDLRGNPPVPGFASCKRRTASSLRGQPLPQLDPPVKSPRPESFPAPRRRWSRSTRW